MASLAELKADVIYRAAKNLGEQILESKLPPFDPATPPPDNDTFRQAAHQAYRQLRESTDPAQKAAAAVEYVQQLINTSHFRPARQVLRRFPALSEGLSYEQLLHLRARQQEKYGWIADAETGYGDAQQRFWQVKKILRKIPPEEWPDDFENLESTATHFGARAKLGLASQGINPEYNLSSARTGFLHDLERFRQLRKQGNPQPFNEGFQFGWLAVASLKRKDLSMADREIQQAQELFQEGLQDNPESGILAHTHLLRGLWYLQQGNPVPSREQFSEAARIRTDVEPYQMGLAFAHLGISATHFQERSFGSSIDHLKQAVNAQPGVLLYLVNGRMLG